MKSNRVKVKIYHLEEGVGKWNEYLNLSSQSCFYQLLEWQLINGEYFKHNVINIVAEIDGKIVGVLPIVSLKSLIFGNILCSMPFVNYGSACADNDEIEVQLVKHACTLTKDLGAKYLELRSQKSTLINLPESKNKISLTLELDKDYDNLWNKYKSKHRTNIRKVYKSGVTVKKGGEELLTDFYYILSKSWKDLGTPVYSQEYFRKIFYYFNKNINIFVAYIDDVPVAAALNGYYKGTVEGMWLGLDNRFRKYQPSYVLYWEMIKDACIRGYSIYHLGRSSVDSGGESFKKKWNAESKQLYWQYYLNKIDEMPNLNPQNPKYKLVINVWRKLPLKITQVVGPLISKYIP
jgi:FemAB-related protein (PEP-CTERM system-associated)